MPTLTWIGKEKVVNHHLEVPYRVLEHRYGYRADNAEDKSFTGSGNMIIHGDNLEALKALLPEYEGKVKCIYIDPPYNTGEEGWVYNDNVNHPKIQKWLGEVVGKQFEDFTRHDKWLCMMYPRLRLLQRLLSEDGVIFISIDDNELYNLKLVCDEIFSAASYVSTFLWEKRLNRENRKEVSSRHDYILCYGMRKNEQGRTLKLLEMTGSALDRYQNPDNDPRGPWKSDPVTAQAGHATKSQFYTLVTPNGNKFNPPNGRCWLYTEPVMQQAIKEGRIWLGLDGNNTPRKKTYLYEKERGLTPESIWFASEVSTNEAAKNELKEIFPETIPFATPKPHQLIERILELASDQNSIILDSFAGSGTTAHAILNLNKKDGGKRKFILVEMEDYADTITAERVRRVMSGYADAEGTGGCFDFYELGDTLFNADGTLNETVGEDRIREYIYYTETKQHLSRKREAANRYLLDTWNGVAYYFYYEQGKETTLNYDKLSIIKQKAERYIVYADTCTLDKDYMNEKSIIFKKIPRDIQKF